MNKPSHFQKISYSRKFLFHAFLPRWQQCLMHYTLQTFPVTHQFLGPWVTWLLYGASPPPLLLLPHSTICILPSNSTSHPIKNCPTPCVTPYYTARGAVRIIPSFQLKKYINPSSVASWKPDGEEVKSTGSVKTLNLEVLKKLQSQIT